ncbi:putative oxidoreductase YrbE [Saccoglossus kowalevskii]|uniref:Trans-1,2-dihydrobenzene-1,2-diol dehydrogenase-like n=1 Tax=Saccoglossus kowalevskii TaxID=10224 RepID=A0ABM0M1Q5_SACKO|nr:PREDICTED: trans-1,2-dihydrobenzene-1,2-diol dehydrogenase-like [Saccoglossus kowalevskii]
MNETKHLTKVNLALIGFGRAGQFHFRNIFADYRVQLSWIVEEDVVRANQVVQNYSLTSTTVIKSKEIDQVWRDDSVNAVIICTPTWTHESLVRAALKAGKHVLCEKPISPSIDSIKSLFAEARSHDRVLFCAFNRRFDPGVSSLKSRIRNGEIGQIQHVKTISRDFPPPSLSYLKTSGGIFHDCAIHDIDLTSWLAGEAPCMVYAQGHAFNKSIHEIGDLDTLSIVLKFPSGILGTIDVSRYAAYGYDQRTEVLGSEGMIQNNNCRPCELAIHKGGSGKMENPIYQSCPERYNDSYKHELNHFIDVVKGEKNKCEVTAEESIMASVVAEACNKSYKLGRPVNIVNGEIITSTMTALNGKEE